MAGRRDLWWMGMGRLAAVVCWGFAAMSVLYPLAFLWGLRDGLGNIWRRSQGGEAVGRFLAVVVDPFHRRLVVGVPLLVVLPFGWGGWWLWRSSRVAPPEGDRGRR